MPVLSFQRGHLIDRPPYRDIGIGRNGADSVPSYRGGLSAHSNETISGTRSRTSDARTVRTVVTALRTSATVDSADACWRRRGKNNTWTPNTAEDTRTGGLAPPAVPPAQTTSIPLDSNRGTVRWGCQPETPKRGAVRIPPVFRRRRMSTSIADRTECVYARARSNTGQQREHRDRIAAGLGRIAAADLDAAGFLG